METIYIVLSASKTKTSKLIRLFTDFKYSHVSISLDKELETMYSFARLYRYMPLIGGLVIEKPNEGMIKVANPDCIVYGVNVTDREFKLIKRRLKRAISNKDVYRYNLLGLILIKFRIKHRLKNRFTCTQFVGYLLEDTKVLGDKDISLLKPIDFYNIGDSVVYTGLLNEIEVCH